VRKFVPFPAIFSSAFGVEVVKSLSCQNENLLHISRYHDDMMKKNN
jgi:hypothetical protein